MCGASTAIPSPILPSRRLTRTTPAHFPQAICCNTTINTKYRPPMSQNNEPPVPPEDGKPEIPDTPTPEQNSGNNVRASWNFSLADVRANLAHCNAEAKEAVISAF